MVSTPRNALPCFAVSLSMLASCQDLSVGGAAARASDAAPVDALGPDGASPDSAPADAVAPDVPTPDALSVDARRPDVAAPDAAEDPCPSACAEIADCAVVQCSLLVAEDREMVYAGCTGYCPAFGASLALLTQSTDDCGRIISTVSLNNPLFANTCGAQR